MIEGTNIRNSLKEFDNRINEEIDLDYAEAKLEHNKKIELAEVEEAVEYLKTDLKLKLGSNLIKSYGTDLSFFDSLTSKHIELLALSFVKWFIEEPEAVEQELKGYILNEVEEGYNSEISLLNILSSAINNEFIELAPDNYRFISNAEYKALKEL